MSEIESRNKRIVDLYNKGVKVDEIASKVGVCLRTVYNVVERSQLQRRNKKITERFICPYFLGRYTLHINCEGISDNTYLSMNFGTGKELNNYADKFCDKEYASRRIARMHEEEI